MTTKAKFSRRTLLAHAGGLAATLGAPSLAWAQGSYPQKMVKITVPHSAEGSPAQVGRLIARRAQEVLGQTFVVETKVGAGGMIGIREVLRMPPDGYELLFLDSSAYSITPAVFRKAKFDPLKDLTAIAPAAVIPYVLAVSPALGVSTLQEFVAHAKKNPGLFYGSSGNGTPHHLAMEILNDAAGLNVKHVPFSGATKAAIALGGGEVAAGFFALQSAQPIARAGKLKILAVGSARRMHQIPDVPTIAESGYPGFNVSTVVGAFAHVNTPREVITRLHGVFTEAAKAPEVLAAIDLLGLMPAQPMTLAEYAKYAQDESKMFARIVERAEAYAD